jgi:ATP-dependent Clp protease ATP-binding subunit ClpB
VTDQNPEGKYESLEKYGRDLTEAAKAGKLDPVIGRDDEIRRTIQILSRRTKNNPVLIGEPGVGKTAIAEGLAQRIVSGDVPPLLRYCRLIALDMGNLIIGVKSQAEFEERLRAVLSEAIHSDSKVILFFDDLQTVVGAGTMDASNLLKLIMVQGEPRLIATTTLNEYRQYIEKDTSLHRLQPVYVKEPTTEDTISILRGLKERYEVHHGVKITDSALVAAANLSNCYISDRFLPDKAIDLVDEAAAKLKIELVSKPRKIDDIDRQILLLEMEKLSLQPESDSASQERLAELKKRLAELNQEQAELYAQWKLERDLIDNIQTLKEEIDRINLEVEQAQRDYDLNRAAELKYGKQEDFRQQLKAAEKQLAQSSRSGKSLLREEVTEETIAEVIAQCTDIAVNQLLESKQ